MSNEFVMVRREAAKQAAHLLAAHSTGPSLERDTAEELLDALEKQAEQYQGEPVALPERMSREHALELSDYPPECAMYWWNACLDEIAKLNGWSAHGK